MEISPSTTPGGKTSPPRRLEIRPNSTSSDSRRLISLLSSTFIPFLAACSQRRRASPGTIASRSSPNRSGRATMAGAPVSSVSCSLSTPFLTRSSAWCQTPSPTGSGPAESRFRFSSRSCRVPAFGRKHRGGAAITLSSVVCAPALLCSRRRLIWQPSPLT